MKQNDTYRKKSGVANSGSNAGVMQLCYFFLNSKKYCNTRIIIFELHNRVGLQAHIQYIQYNSKDTCA
jgi:hypothetical protein